MMNNKFLSLVLLAVFLLPLSAAAETVLRFGADAAVAEEQVVGNDLYMSAGLFERTVMTGAVTGDYYTAGSAVLIDGSVGEDIFAFAGSVDVRASTTDDVRVVGGDVTLSGSVGGDLFVIAGTLEVLPEATIAGDVLVFAGDVELAAPIGGSVFGAAERVRIDGTVAGNVELRAPAGVTLGEAAAIEGNLVYESRTDLVRSPNSVIEGEIQERTIEVLATEASTRSVVTPLFMLLFSALTLYLLFKRQLQAMSEDMFAHPLILGGIGAGSVLAGPLVALVLMFTVLATPLGIAMLGFLLILYAFAFVLAGILFGVYGSRWLFGQPVVTVPVIVGGVTVLYALTFVPVAGMVVATVAYFMAIGALVRFTIRKLGS